MTPEERIEELERRVKELESLPAQWIVVPSVPPYYQPWPPPYYQPLPPCPTVIW